jgi:hypothetical protein
MQRPARMPAATPVAGSATSKTGVNLAEDLGHAQATKPWFLGAVEIKPNHGMALK